MSLRPCSSSYPDTYLNPRSAAHPTPNKPAATAALQEPSGISSIQIPSSPSKKQSAPEEHPIQARYPATSKNHVNSTPQTPARPFPPRRPLRATNTTSTESIYWCLCICLCICIRAASLVSRSQIG
jgi:hypothetical protein